MKLILVLLFLGSSYALAGTESSGGGPGVVCRDGANNITSVELYDLFEGTIRHNLDIQKTAVNPTVQMQTAISRLDGRAAFKDTLRYAVGVVAGRIDFLPPGIVLDSPSDLGDGHGIVIPNGCRIEAIGYYEDTGELKVSKTLYDLLSATDKAAFILHEAIYALYRQEGATDSADTRRLNAVLFASNSSEEDILERTESFRLSIGPDEVISVPADDLDVKIKVTAAAGVKFEAAITCSNFSYVPLTGGTFRFKGTGSKSVTTDEISGCPQNGLMVEADGAGPITFEVFSQGVVVKTVTVPADKFGHNIYDFQLRFPNLSLPNLP